MSDRISNLLRIDKLGVGELSKRRLQDCVASRDDVLEQIIVIDGCIDIEELRGNHVGVIELLEYKLETMHTSDDPDQFSERECTILADRIQSLAIKQDQLAREARKVAEAARQASTQVLYEERPRFKSGRRGSKRRGVW